MILQFIISYHLEAVERREAPALDVHDAGGAAPADVDVAPDGAGDLDDAGGGAEVKGVAARQHAGAVADPVVVGIHDAAEVELVAALVGVRDGGDGIGLRARAQPDEQLLEKKISRRLACCFLVHCLYVGKRIRRGRAMAAQRRGPPSRDESAA